MNEMLTSVIKAILKVVFVLSVEIILTAVKYLPNTSYLYSVYLLEKKNI
jgi:hypothetical protein